MDSRPSSPKSLMQLLLLGAWFGIVTGLVEGAGLLLFQHINWQNWGRMLHVSSQILWISPVVDLFLFSAVAAFFFLLGRLAPSLPSTRLMVFFLVGLATYDWLTLTDRLWHISCLLLAVGAAVTFDRWFAGNEDKALRFWTRTVPWTAALLLLVFLAIEGGGRWRERQSEASLPPPDPGAPNVIVIVLDALRADHVSAYGYPRATTPDIDRLAAEGVLFEHAIATASWSLPSHASLVTGRYQFEHGAEDIRAEPWFGYQSSGFSGYPTLGQALASRGYRSAAFSANRVYFTHDSGFQTAFLHFEDYFYSPRDAILRTLYGRELVRLYLARRRKSFVMHKRADVVNQELLRWVDRGPKRPFLVFLNYFDVHDPYGGPPRYPKPAWGLKTSDDSYDAGLKYDNDYIARLLAELEQRGMAKNTLLVITSDHGESLGQHGLLTHSRALYWELVHVPLVIWYPGHVPAGVRVDRPVSSASIPATVMDLLSPGKSSAFPGPPLTQLWTSPAAASGWPFPLSEIARNPYPEAAEKPADQMAPTSTTGWIKSLVTPQWQLIVHQNLGNQLYDWVHDPEEKNNLAETPEGGAVAADLAATMRAMLGKAAPPEVSPAGASPLHDGAFDFDPATRLGAAGQPVSDFYRIAVAPGSKVTIEVVAGSLRPSSHLDPVVAIQDAHGDTLRACRNPGDDHLRFPGIADSTPDAFDDLCYNDDSQPGVRDSKLEFSRPAAAGSTAEFYLHVMDWNPGQAGRKNYRIILTGVDPRS
jgi:arylsulfatase A-like enzyme